MDEQHISVSIFLTVAGLILFYKGFKIGMVKREHGFSDLILGIGIMILALFMIRHGNIYPPVTEPLELVLGPFWQMLKELHAGFKSFMGRVDAFDVESLGN